MRRDFETEVKRSRASPRRRLRDLDRLGRSLWRHRRVDGWKVANYPQEPRRALDARQHHAAGRQGVNVRIEDGALRPGEFTPAGLVKFNDIVFSMLKTGFLSATSVGFIPLKYNFVDDPQRRFGIDFLEQELLEFSIVTVPANAEALIEGRGAPEPAEVTAAAPNR
jgi:HK97 family phage prohead protease